MCGRSINSGTTGTGCGRKTEEINRSPSRKEYPRVFFALLVPTEYAVFFIFALFKSRVNHTLLSKGMAVGFFPPKDVGIEGICVGEWRKTGELKEKSEQKLQKWHTQ